MPASLTWLWSSAAVDPVSLEPSTRFVRPSSGKWNEYQRGVLFANFAEISSDQLVPAEGVIPEYVIMHDKSRDIWVKLTKSEAFFQHGPVTEGIPKKWTSLSFGSFIVARLNDQTVVPQANKKTTVLQFTNPKKLSSTWLEKNIFVVNICFCDFPPC